MKFFTKLALTLAALGTLSAPAAAQRVLELDPDEPWVHPHSAISIPTELSGLPRGRATEFAEDFLNLGFSFRAENDADEISLYIYRNTNGAIPVWFEQARRGIEARDIYAGPELVYEIAPYAWPGQTDYVGMRAFYDTPNAQSYSSTGLVLFSIDGWYVKLRASSANRSAANLSLLVDAALREIALPERSGPQPEPIPVIECEEKLEFKKKAKDAKVDGATSLLNALMGSVAAEGLGKDEGELREQRSVSWCRDDALNPQQVAYRADASKDSYLIALGDSGMGISVAPDAGAALMDTSSGGKPKSFSVTVITDNQRIDFVPQNRLPSLERVMELINKNRRVSATSTWGDNSKIELNPDAL